MVRKETNLVCDMEASMGGLESGLVTNTYQHKFRENEQYWIVSE